MSTTYQTGNATKSKILTLSKLLFHQKGYAATTYTDISASANVNRALIPYHFQSKPILGKAVFQEILSQTHTKLDTILDMSQFSADFAGMLHLMSFYYLYRIIRLPHSVHRCLQMTVTLYLIMLQNKLNSYLLVKNCLPYLTKNLAC